MSACTSACALNRNRDVVLALSSKSQRRQVPPMVFFQGWRFFVPMFMLSVAICCNLHEEVEASLPGAWLGYLREVLSFGITCSWNGVCRSSRRKTLRFFARHDAMAMLFGCRCLGSRRPWFCWSC